MSLVASQTSPLLADGFQFLPDVLTERELSDARFAQEELMAGRINREPAFSWPAPKARQCRSWKTPYSTHFRDELASLACSETLLASIAAATQAKSLRLWFDQLLWEEPARANTPQNYHWHTERSRWKTCQSRLMVTAWIPLASITVAMGPITMVRKSSRRRWLELPDGWQPEKDNVLPSPVQPGDAALFCWHTVHGNPPNLGDSPRRAIALHYAVDELSYRPHGKFNHLNERVVRRLNALPDFEDNKVCPLVW